MKRSLWTSGSWCWGEDARCWNSPLMQMLAIGHPQRRTDSLNHTNLLQMPREVIIHWTTGIESSPPQLRLSGSLVLFVVRDLEWVASCSSTGVLERLWIPVLAPVGDAHTDTDPATTWLAYHHAINTDWIQIYWDIFFFHLHLSRSSFH